MRVTAAVLYDVRKPLVVEDVDLLEPGPHEVLVRWKANGVCHSDLHVMTGDYPHPLPVVLGHEAAGVVEKIGPGVESVAPGDHVCSSYIPSCGKCWYCIGGQPTMCALRDKPRWFMLDGTPRFQKNGQGLHHFLQVSGYATHAVLPDVSVIPIRKDAPLDVVCLVSCGVLAGAGPVFNRAKVPPGASVAVWGCGGVGLNTIQAAKLVGAGKIIAVDVVKQKLDWAQEFGATHVVDASTGGSRRARAGAERHRRRRLRLRGRGHPEDHRAGPARHASGRDLRDRGRVAGRHQGLRRPVALPAAARAHRELVRRRASAHRRADADRSLHERPVSARRADHPARGARASSTTPSTSCCGARSSAASSSISTWGAQSGPPTPPALRAQAEPWRFANVSHVGRRM